MDARELEGKMGYLGMERAARKILLDEKLGKAEGAEPGEEYYRLHIQKVETREHTG